MKLPPEVDDDDAILLSDIFPTGYMAAENAEIKPGNTVAVFGCGPVGQFSIASAKLLDAGRIFAVDSIESRLDMARDQGAEVINFDKDDPVETLKLLTAGIGVDRVIDAVGIDANRPHSGPAENKSKKEHKGESKQVTPDKNPQNGNWQPGDAPSQAVSWAIESIAKAGTFSIVGVYGNLHSFPIADAMEKNLTIRRETVIIAATCRI